MLIFSSAQLPAAVLAMAAARAAARRRARADKLNLEITGLNGLNK